MPAIWRVGLASPKRDCAHGWEFGAGPLKPAGERVLSRAPTQSRATYRAFGNYQGHRCPVRTSSGVSGWCGRSEGDSPVRRTRRWS